MVHPKVLANCGIDPREWQGFAFGMGIERITMLKHGMPDLRPFYEADIRWLRHYAADPLAPPSLARGRVLHDGMRTFHASLTWRSRPHLRELTDEVHPVLAAEHLDTTLARRHRHALAIGLEVEGIEDRGAALAAFRIARVIEAVQHPNADRLRALQRRCRRRPRSTPSSAARRMRAPA